GTDLLKPLDVLIRAYDDPLGVTAAFNRNLLVRINRELGANFDLQQFEHLAIFNEQTRSIEMHVRSRRHQTVTIANAGRSFQFKEGETIWTESSHKYSVEELAHLAQVSG